MRPNTRLLSRRSEKKLGTMVSMVDLGRARIADYADNLSSTSEVDHMAEQ